MTATPSSAELLADPIEAASSVESGTVTLKSLRLRRLLVTLPAANLVLSAFWASIQAIFLAVQVQAIDPRNAVSALALVVGVGAMGSIVVGPIAGQLSDRTRTRIGGRAPWVLCGLALTVGSALLLASARSIAQLVGFWLLLQASTAFISTPMLSHIPDRVPVARRGVFSGVNGLATLVGAIVGQSIAASFVSAITAGYIVVTALLVVGVLAFVLVNARSNVGEPKPPLDVVGVLRTFWVNPVKHPDFAWTFAGRFLLFAGYFTVSAYQLYLLQSYVGLGDGAAAVVPLLGLVGLGGMVVSTLAGGLLVDRLGHHTKLIIYVTGTVLAAGLIIPFFVPTLIGMLIYSLVSGLGFGAYQSVDFVLVTRVLPSAEETGKDLGLINVTSSLPQTLGVAIASAVVTVFGGFGALFPVAAIAAIVGVFLILPVRLSR